MKSINKVSALAVLGVSLSVSAYAANHNDRHLFTSEELDSTYGTSDTRRNDWREERRENCCDMFHRKSEHRYGTADERKDYWRNHYRDSHSTSSGCKYHAHEKTHSH